jgi:hypothetical protein
MRALGSLVVAVLLAGCPPSPGTDGGVDGGRVDGGPNGLEAFANTTLDTSGHQPLALAMTIDRATDRIGVAYFVQLDTMATVGVPDYELRYLEWRPGGITVRPERVRIVQRVVGVSLAFHPTTGEPAIAFLGGDDTFVPGMSIFWFQSDAALARRNNGVWTETLVARTGGDVICNNPVSDRGLLVGLWAALVYDGAGQMVFAWRDGHDTTLMDWQGSDVESAEGSLPNPTLKCVNPGGNGGLAGKPAWGGRIQLAVGAGGQPAMVYDRAQFGADTTGIQVWFQQRSSAGAWSLPAQILDSNDTQTGASLAWDSTEGYGVAAVDGVSGGLHYKNSMDGTSWSAVDDVFGAGSGGWYPSLAIDPQFHEPNVAYYVCSPRDGVVATACPQSDDELQVARRTASGWQAQRVDAEGGWSPKLGFLSTGKRFVVYRHPFNGSLKLAVER